MGVVLVGVGAFGIKHIQSINNINGINIVALVDTDLEKARIIAQDYGIAHVYNDLADALALENITAVILCTPSQLHAEQAIQCLRAGKHVQVEIPLALNLKDALAVDKLQRESGLVCMVGHTRRYNSSHDWLHNSITRKERCIQHMDVQTYFLRRSNINAKGEPRCWSDHLLWHHAAHTVDLFAYQTGEAIVMANAVQGPIHPHLGIAMDMSIQLKTASAKICTLSLSFNNDGPIGTIFRYICDSGTFLVSYDDLVNGYNESIDVSQTGVSMNGIELQDRDFFAAIESGQEPRSSVANVLPCYHVLDKLEKSLSKQA